MARTYVRLFVSAKLFITLFFTVSQPNNHNREKIFQKSVHSLGNYLYICLVNSVIVRKPNF